MAIRAASAEGLPDLLRNVECNVVEEKHEDSVVEKCCNALHRMTDGCN